MNLPASAVTFLPHFRSISSLLPRGPARPMVHVHLFTSAPLGAEMERDAVAQVMAALASGSTSVEPLEDVTVTRVRNVAPRREMVCVSMRVPVFKDHHVQALAGQKRARREKE